MYGDFCWLLFATHFCSQWNIFAFGSGVQVYRQWGRPLTQKPTFIYWTGLDFAFHLPNGRPGSEWYFYADTLDWWGWFQAGVDCLLRCAAQSAIHVTSEIHSSVADASFGHQRIPTITPPSILSPLSSPLHISSRDLVSLVLLLCLAFQGSDIEHKKSFHILSDSVHAAFTMSPISIGPGALSELKDLSKWLSETTAMEQEQNNLFRCVDEARHSKVTPLLEKLGFKIKVSCLIF